MQQVVKLMTLFCRMLWMPGGYMGVTGKKIKEEKILEVVSYMKAPLLWKT